MRGRCRSARSVLIFDLRLSDSRFDAIEVSFDLALRSGPLSESSLKGRKLADDTRVLCASPAYLEAHGTPATPADLTGQQLIAWSNLGPRGLVNAAGEKALLDPASMVCRTILDDADAQRDATLAGAGLSMNSLWNVAQASGLVQGAWVQTDGPWRWLQSAFPLDGGYWRGALKLRPQRA